MSSGKNLTLLAIVAVAAAAVLFSRKSPPTETPVVHRDEPRSTLPRRLPGSDRARGAAQYLLAGQDDGAAKMPTAATPGSIDPQLGFDFAPTTGQDYGHWSNPAGALLGSHAETSSAGTLAMAPRTLQSQPQAPAVLERRTHVVVDGDTLTGLAARYLGSSDRFREIFDANRNVLAKPDLLPIGATLTIPASPPGAGEVALPPARETGLVPVSQRALRGEAE